MTTPSVRSTGTAYLLRLRGFHWAFTGLSLGFEWNKYRRFAELHQDGAIFCG